EEGTARKAVEGYFYVDNFRFDSITLTPEGVVTIDYDVGPIVDDRMMLLRAAAAGYAYSRILFANPKMTHLVLNQSGTRSIREKPEHIKAITLEMTRELADRVNWQEMERAIAMDKEFEPALEVFFLKNINPAFESILSPKLYLRAEESAGNPANVRK
ncbi:MAG: hypothetical protein OQJ76_05345, partial [Rhodospirillales bacterium]|nr:hypothetical protein [Rhodospirillales bacterium]